MMKCVSTNDGKFDGFESAWNGFETSGSTNYVGKGLAMVGVTTGTSLPASTQVASDMESLSTDSPCMGSTGSTHQLGLKGVDTGYARTVWSSGTNDGAYAAYRSVPTPAPTPFPTEVLLRVDPTKQGEATKISQMGHQRCNETLIETVSNITKDECVSRCKGDTACELIVYVLQDPDDNTTVTKCDICTGDRGMIDTIDATASYVVDDTVADCIGYDYNRCELYENCSARVPHSGYHLEGRELSNTNISGCRELCRADRDCTFFSFWPSDQSCELCSEGLDLRPTLVPTQFYHKLVDTRYPLRGTMRNARMWDRVLPADVVSQAGEDDTCDDEGCKTTNGFLADHRLDTCGGWDTGDLTWPRHGGKLFVKCDNCTYAEPENVTEAGPELTPPGLDAAALADIKEGKYRLVPTSARTPLKGRLEVEHNGTWGSVCGSDGTTAEKNAFVACRGMGRGGGSATGAACATAGPEGASRCGTDGTVVWKDLDALKCDGSEAALEHCAGFSSVWNDTSGVCTGHDDDLIIQCNSEAEGDVKIVPVDEDDASYGRLEIFHDGGWGTVCSLGFSNLAANVACKQMGYTSGTVAASGCVIVSSATMGFMCGEASQRVWLDDATCEGTEDHMMDCPRLPFSLEDRCGHDLDVLVQCARSTTIDKGGELIQLGEDGDVIKTGTGSTMVGENRTRTHLSELSTRPRIFDNRPLPVRSTNKPHHDQYNIKCGQIRLSQAENSVCFPAKSNKMIYERCIADYCLTGDTSLASTDVNQMFYEEQEGEMMKEEEALLHEEQLREEAEEAELQSEIDVANAKNAEQDRVVAQTIGAAGALVNPDAAAVAAQVLARYERARAGI